DAGAGTAAAGTARRPARPRARTTDGRRYRWRTVDINAAQHGGPPGSLSQIRPCRRTGAARHSPAEDCPRASLKMGSFTYRTGGDKGTDPKVPKGLTPCPPLFDRCTTPL